MIATAVLRNKLTNLAEAHTFNLGAFTVMYLVPTLTRTVGLQLERGLAVGIPILPIEISRFVPIFART